MCLIASSPPLSVPGLSQAPLPWILLALEVASLPYVVWTIRTLFIGRVRRVGVVVAVFMWMCAMTGTVSLALYTYARSNLMSWHEEQAARLSQLGCSLSTLDAAYSKAQAGTDATGVIYHVSLIGVQCMLALSAGYVLLRWVRRG
jgi:hypothetical protein